MAGALPLSFLLNGGKFRLQAAEVISMTVSEAIVKLLLTGGGTPHDDEHFMKVWGYAHAIGMSEGLTESEQLALEYAAVVHDIACPSLRKETGKCDGRMQEERGGAMAREFFRGSGLPPDLTDRIVFLVSHHHTYEGVEGQDWRILIEADCIANAVEQSLPLSSVSEMYVRHFRTGTGRAVMRAVFPGLGEGEPDSGQQGLFAPILP